MLGCDYADAVDPLAPNEGKTSTDLAASVVGTEEKRRGTPPELLDALPRIEKRASD